MNAPARSLVVVTAGLSQPSSTRLLADRLAASTGRSLDDLGITAATEVIELRELAHEVTNNLLAGFPSGTLRAAQERVAGADGLIAVTPIFTASYSGLFKSFFDVLDKDSLTGTPVLIGATGGTARHSLALEHAVRPMFTYLRSAVVPTSVYAASEDFGNGGELTGRIERAGTELAELIAGRSRRAAHDGFDAPIPFEELLAAQYK